MDITQYEQREAEAVAEAEEAEEEEEEAYWREYEAAETAWEIERDLWD